MTGWRADQPVVAHSATALQPGEPTVARWRTCPAAELVARLADPVESERPPAIWAVDGRSGAGKSTLTERLRRHLRDVQVLTTDDLAWCEPLYGWQRLLVEALTRLRETGRLDFTPPAWPANGRPGAIAIEPAQVVIVEGTGAGMQAAAELIDALVWVQTDDLVAERRGIQRDIAEGTNGDTETATRFWHDWMAAERPFFAADRPWERADLIVCGDPPPGLDPRLVAWAPGPLSAAVCP